MAFTPREYIIVRGKVLTSRFALASLSCTVTIMSNKGLILYCTGVVERSHSACASFACFVVVPPRTGFLSPRSYVAGPTITACLPPTLLNGHFDLFAASLRLDSVRVAGSMPLLEVATFMWIFSLQRRLYNSYLGTTYNNCVFF